MIAFLIIPSLLSVSTIRLKKSAPKKVWRPSKTEVREGFITHVTSDAEMRSVLHQRQKKFSEFGLSLQPYIIIVGESLSEIVSYFIVINETQYIVKNIVSAVNICFKIIWVVNAEYAAECQGTWMFIQKALYNLNTRGDKESTATNTLIADLGLH